LLKIGLVLHKTPSKSEKFLTSKIKGLQNNGHRVILFAHNEDNFKLCEVVESVKISRLFLLQIIRMVLRYLIIIFKSPLVVSRYLNLEKLDGVSFQKRWENLYLNSTILDKKLHWIHFCFATTAIRKENIAKAINAKMGVSLRGYDVNIYPLKNPNCYYLLWRKVDKVHSISYALLEKAKALGLTDNINKMVIFPAIDRNIFTIKYANKDLRSNHKIEILTVARLHWIKGLEYTIEALAKLKDIDFNYTIIGSGEEYERITLIINQFKLTEKVRLVGHVAQKDLTPFYKKAHIYVQYSIEEGFCNAVIEAQSMGLLTVVSNASGLKENIINGKTGWIVPKREPILLAKKIEQIINVNSSKLNKIRSNSIERVKNKFDLNYQNEQFNKFFNDYIF